MKDLYKKLSSLLELPEIVEGRVPLEEIWTWQTALEDNVRQFFTTQYPMNGIDGHLQILPAGDVVSENHDMGPGRFANPYGFLAFGCTLNGDAICADGFSGSVVILPHESISDESVTIGWNEETGKFIEAPLSRESFYKVANCHFTSIKSFFEDWITSIEQSRERKKRQE